MFANPFMALMVYSAAIITMPIFTFFGGKNVAESWLGFEEGNIVGAVTAVVAVHVILFAFVYRAFQEEKVIAKEREQKNE